MSSVSDDSTDEPQDQDQDQSHDQDSSDNLPVVREGPEQDDHRDELFWSEAQYGSIMLNEEGNKEGWLFIDQKYLKDCKR